MQLLTWCENRKTLAALRIYLSWFQVSRTWQHSTWGLVTLSRIGRTVCKKDKASKIYIAPINWWSAFLILPSSTDKFEFWSKNTHQSSTVKSTQSHVTAHGCYTHAAYSLAKKEPQHQDSNVKWHSSTASVVSTGLCSQGMLFMASQYMVSQHQKRLMVHWVNFALFLYYVSPWDHPILHIWNQRVLFTEKDSQVGFGNYRSTFLWRSQSKTSHRIDLHIISSGLSSDSSHMHLLLFPVIF